MEFFAEWLVNPTNTVYRKVHGGEFFQFFFFSEEDGIELAHSSRENYQIFIVAMTNIFKETQLQIFVSEFLNKMPHAQSRDLVDSENILSFFVRLLEV